MAEATRRIHKFAFKDVNSAHVALVDRAANLQTVLTMKSAPAQHDVQVTLPMKNFLKVFFDMWEEDAAILAGVLGFEPNLYNDQVKENGAMLTAEELVQQKIDSVSLLKGMEIPDTAPSEVVLKIEELMKEFGDKLPLKDSPSKDITDNGESKLDKVEISVEELNELKSAMAGQKALELQLEVMRKSAEKKEKESLLICIKGYSFVAEESQEALVDSLMATDESHKEVILKALEGAREAVTAAASIDGEVGATGADKEDEQEMSLTEKSYDLVQSLIDERKA